MTLSERIRGEITDLDRSATRIAAAWARGKKATSDQDYYLDAAGLNLHSFYSGLVPAKMQGPIERLPALWPRLRAELIAFAAFLERISAD